MVLSTVGDDYTPATVLCYQYTWYLSLSSSLLSSSVL